MFIISNLLYVFKKLLSNFSTTYIIFWLIYNDNIIIQKNAFEKSFLKNCEGHESDRKRGYLWRTENYFKVEKSVL